MKQQFKKQWAAFRHWLKSDQFKCSSEQQLIIGLGTGRCGTVSLANLLDGQNDCRVFHEIKPILPWRMDNGFLAKRMNHLYESKQSFIGEVGSSYLPYVEQIIEWVPNAKFVCLKRNQAKTVASFMRKTEGRNHWMKHDGQEWKKDEWDDFFPKFEINNKKEALNAYWETYYKESERLAQKHPGQFKIFATEVLNNEKELVKLFDFLGIPQAQINHIHLND